MRFIKLALMFLGGLALCGGLTCGYFVYQHSASTETWVVRFPEHPLSDPETAAAVRRNLLARAASLQSMGEPTVRYQGAGVFGVELSAPARSAALISSSLSDPGEFWVRAVPNGSEPSCEGSVPSVISPGSIEEASVGFDRDGEPVVTIRLTLPAGESFREHSRHNSGRVVSLCLGQQLLSAPTIRAEAGRYLQIGGLESVEETSRLAAILNGGPIPEGASASRVGAAAW